MKKTITVLILLIAVTCGIRSQSITPQILAATGGFSANGTNYTMTYTVAEMTMVNTFTAGSYMLTQGFQQPSDSLISGLLDVTADNFGSFVVYPNPAVNNVWFGMQFPEAGTVSVSILDLLGQKTTVVFTSGYTSGKMVEQWDVSAYAPAMYLMSVALTDGFGKAHVINKKFQVVK